MSSLIHMVYNHVINYLLSENSRKDHVSYANCRNITYQQVLWRFESGR